MSYPARAEGLVNIDLTKKPNETMTDRIRLCDGPLAFVCVMMVLQGEGGDLISI